MMIALFANMKKKESYAVAKQICQFLKDRNVTVVTREEEAKELGVSSLSSVDPQEIRFLISLGGDGTILRMIHHFPELDAPILGVNLGRLGFMADVPLADLFPSLEELLSGAYRIEKRLMMEGKLENGKRCFAVNEMVIHRSRIPCLIDLAIHVDDKYLNTFSADGIIISTPNGSTAYSLAAGGPILTPELDAFVITPIAAHTISNRPLVLMPKKKLEVKYLSRYEPVEIIYDGFPEYKLATNEIFSVTRAKRTFKMVALERTDYYATLRTKLGWTGQFRFVELNHQREDRDLDRDLD